MKKITTHVSQEKKERLSELEKLIKNKRTILIASIKNIPGSQFQEISKKLRGKAIVKVPKKSIIFRALDSLNKEDSVKKLKEKIEGSTAILFSDEDSFELASELISKKSPSRAKPGQKAPFDIEIPAGPTELVPGPAISELGALGIQIQIEKGKITIKEPKIIVKEDKEISQAAADIMSKLDIKPFSVGFIPLAAFDNNSGKVYLNINVDKEGTLKNIKESFSKSIGFAVSIGYVSGDTISFLIGKASMQGKALESLIEKPVQEEKKEDEKPAESEETQTQENSQEDKK